MVRSTPVNVEAAYRDCEMLAKTHYENFPVASLLLPKKIRRPISVIYTFARLADDMADEGNEPQESRLAQLQNFWQSLEDLEKGLPPKEGLFIALNDVLKNNPKLPISLFFDLLHAFKQDVVKNEYQNFLEVLDYCHHSANPIGRLLLYLTDKATEDNLKHSDAICTALQLINFLQDLQSDLLLRNRCYLPQDEMAQFNLSLEDFKAGKNSAAIQEFIGKQLHRTEVILEEGTLLTQRLTGLFGLEIRLTVEGGRKIIQLLKKRRNVYARPSLKPWHWPVLLWRACKNG